MPHREAIHRYDDANVSHVKGRHHRHLATADGAGATVLEGEERQNRPGSSHYVAVVEVIGVRVIEVDGSLDEPQSEDLGVEVHVLLGSVAMDVT